MNGTAIKLISACAVVGLGACGEARDPGPRMQVTVAALELPGVDEAVYTLAVHNADDQLVWRAEGLRSTRYGDARGALTYIGTCNASASPNRVTLILDELWAGRLLEDPADYRNPAPAPAGIVKADVVCDENADTLVELNLTILRSADQGFFDIAVDFEDVFCSAKLDCQDALLHDPDGERGPTAVVAFACTAGEGDDTYLYLDPVRVVCGDDSYAFLPVGAPGNHGALGPVVHQAAMYTGHEGFTAFDKCYWNVAFGLDLAALAANGPCHIEARGTAAGTRFTNGTSPDAVYPVITWDVPLTLTDGALACGSHPLNGVGSGVQTTYTGFAGEPFGYELDCATTTITPPGQITCEGSTSALGDLPVTATMIGERTLVATVGTTSTPPYTLPAGLRVATGTACCVDPCCD